MREVVLVLSRDFPFTSEQEGWYGTPRKQNKRVMSITGVDPELQLI